MSGPHPCPSCHIALTFRIGIIRAWQGGGLVTLDLFSSMSFDAVDAAIVFISQMTSLTIGFLMSSLQAFYGSKEGGFGTCTPLWLVLDWGAHHSHPCLFVTQKPILTSCEVLGHQLARATFGKPLGVVCTPQACMGVFFAWLQCMPHYHWIISWLLTVAGRAHDAR